MTCELVAEDGSRRVAEYQSIGVNVSASVYDARTALLIGQRQVVFDAPDCATSMYIDNDGPDDERGYVDAESITGQLQSILAI